MFYAFDCIAEGIFFFWDVRLFLDNLLAALWTIGPHCVCDAFKWVPSPGRLGLLPPIGGKIQGEFGHLSFMYHRSAPDLVMENCAVAIAMEVLWRQVTWHSFCIFFCRSAKRKSIQIMSSVTQYAVDYYHASPRLSLFWYKKLVLYIRLGFFDVDSNSFFKWAVYYHVFDVVLSCEGT